MKKIDKKTLYMRIWREKNPERTKEINRISYWKNRELRSKKHKLYYQLHKEEIKQRVKDRVVKNREEINRKQKEYRDAHPEYMQNYRKQNRLYYRKHWEHYYQKNRDYMIMRSKKWAEENPTKRKVIALNRRVRTKDLTIAIIQQVYEDNIKQFGTLTCYLCLEPISFGKDNLEHIIPVCRGGSNKRDNLDISCQKCNLKKGIKTKEEFRKYLCEA